MQSSRALQALSGPSNLDSAEDEDEDEETLSLKLQAIEARLKLKKLQQARKDKRAADAIDRDGQQMSPRLKRLKVDPGVEIPVSPTKDRIAPQQNLSPAKLLGLDRGLRAQDVSLKRARTGPASAIAVSASSHYAARPEEPMKKGKSFGERLADSRLNEQERQAKQERIERVRGKSSGFGNISTASGTAETMSANAKGRASTPNNEGTTKSAPFRKPVSDSNQSTVKAAKRPENSTNEAVPKPKREVHRKQNKPDTDGTETEESFDSYSSTHLSRRSLAHTDLTRVLSDKEVYTIPRLLKEVKSPEYDPPDCEADYVVFAIIASKSSPYDLKGQPKTDDEDAATGPKNKFMVLKLTDLNWELDLFLFDGAFSRYWKLTPGTLIAILNPAIMPPKTSYRDTGRFSLKLTTTDDEILEIGSARDLGFCTSMKKDGQLCDAWINKRKTQHCDFHVNLLLDRTRASRMEVNGMFRYSGTTRSGSPDSSSSRRHPRARLYYPGSSAGAPAHTAGRKRDHDTGERYYLGPSSGTGRTTAQMLDSEDLARPEAMRKRLAAAEKERELARKLGKLGNGIGAEYLRAGVAKTDEPSKDDDGAAAGEGEYDAEAAAKRNGVADLMGEVRRKDGAEVRLSPVRGRKRAFPFAASASSSSARGSAAAAGRGSEAVGWGGAFKRGIGGSERREMSPEKGQTRLNIPRTTTTTGTGGAEAERAVPRSASPKKRARFVLDKGVRVPGRESVGDVVLGNDDDDDGLDIVG